MTEERTAQYLYQDGTYFHFMDPESYEQFELTKETRSARSPTG